MQSPNVSEFRAEGRTTIGSRLQLWARIGICIQFVALIRCLGEYFRLKHFAPEKFSIVHIEPFILGALVTAVLALAGISFYFGEKYRLTAIIAALNILILLVLRFTLF
jgi:hypothetical protein